MILRTMATGVILSMMITPSWSDDICAIPKVEFSNFSIDGSNIKQGVVYIPCINHIYNGCVKKILNWTLIKLGRDGLMSSSDAEWKIVHSDGTIAYVRMDVPNQRFPPEALRDLITIKCIEGHVS